MHIYTPTGGCSKSTLSHVGFTCIPLLITKHCLSSAPGQPPPHTVVSIAIQAPPALSSFVVVPSVVLDLWYGCVCMSERVHAFEFAAKFSRRSSLHVFTNQVVCISVIPTLIADALRRTMMVADFVSRPQNGSPINGEIPGQNHNNSNMPGKSAQH